MERKEAIRGAYRMTGGNSFYDGMITCSTLSGKAVCRLVWAMNKAENDDYLEKALSGIPEHFSGKLLEVPVGTGIPGLSDYAGGGHHLPRLLGGYDGAGAGKSEPTESEQHNLSAGRCGCASLCRRLFWHCSVAERLSRFPGQGGSLSGDFPGLETRRDILRLLLCEGRAQADGLVCPARTVSSLKARLDGMYTDVDMGNLKSMAWFVCRKAE